MMSRRFSNISVFLTVLLILGCTLLSEAGKETKRVLILYSQEKGHPAHDLTERGIRAAFLSNSLFDVQIYTEYLDVGRFPGSSNISAVADYLRQLTPLEYY